jgi:hypothetical protein
MHEARSFSPWVSASRDSDATTASFKTWLASLPVIATAPCFIITDPHSAQATTWGKASHSLLSCFPESGEVFILDGDLQTVLTLSYVGVARFTTTAVTS